MKKLFLLVGLILAFASWSYAADEYVHSDQTLDKHEEFKTMVKDKKQMPDSLGDMKSVTGEQAYELWKTKKATFIDTRPKAQYDAEKIPGAIHLDCDKFIENPELAKSLDKNKQYVTYCSGNLCRLSPMAALALKNLGFKHVTYYKGGLPDWKAKGYPLK